MLDITRLELFHRNSLDKILLYNDSKYEPKIKDNMFISANNYPYTDKNTDIVINPNVQILYKNINLLLVTCKNKKLYLLNNNTYISALTYFNNNVRVSETLIKHLIKEY